MKSVYCLATAFLVSISITTPGGAMPHGFGTARYNHERVACINSCGSVFLEGTQVTGSVCVNGHLSACSAHVSGSVHVNGRVDCANCSFEESVSVNGTLSPRGTRFAKEVSVASEELELIDCDVHEIVVRLVQPPGKLQVVRLVNTTVSGSITIEAGHGEVWISPSSIVLGEIRGAKIYRK